MGHDGMLYSLPSRELIADSVEYMVNAHCADALVCISNCDKITPGMLMAAHAAQHPDRLRLGRPDGGRQGRAERQRRGASILSTPWSPPPTTTCQRRGSGDDRALGLPDLRLLLGHVHRQLDELPDRSVGPVAARQRLDRWRRMPTASGCSVEAGHVIVDLARRWYEQDDATALPRSIASFAAFENAMRLDIAMGGSTNTVLHLLAAAQEGGVDFTMADIDRLSRRVPVPVQGGAGKVRRAHGGRASRRRHDGDPGRTRPRRAYRHAACRPCMRRPWPMRWAAGTSRAPTSEEVRRLLPRGARRRADAGRLQPGAALRGARHRSRRRASSASPSSLLAGTAASRCCTAISPRTAAS